MHAGRGCGSLETHDLAIAKYVASREKDLVFTRELVARADD
jgi:hypothetical protein